MEIKFIDTNGIAVGKNLMIDLCSDSLNWDVLSQENVIVEHNDNRADRYHGKTTKLVHKSSNVVITCDKSVSNTGKTVWWSFSTDADMTLEELCLLLDVERAKKFCVTRFGKKEC